MTALYARRRIRPRTGVTLVELMVVVSLLGISAAVVVLAWRPSKSRLDGLSARLEAVRQAALTSGAPATITFVDSAGAHPLTAMPDGSVIADAALGVDRLTGRPFRRATAPSKDAVEDPDAGP